MQIPHFFRMPDAVTGAAPVAQSERILIIDSLRGFALLGILLMNIPYFADSYYVAFNLDVRNEYSGRNYYTWWIINGFFEGTMRALFSMLFGAGTILLLSRLEKKKDLNMTPADFYYRRIIWLLIFGLINAYILLWAGDILYSYALCGLFLYPLRNLKGKHLLMLGIAIMLVANVRMTLDLYKARNTRIKGEKALAIDTTRVKLTEEQEGDRNAWQEYQRKHTREYFLKETEKERKAYRGGYFSLMAFMKDINVKIQTSIMYDEYFWDTLAFFLIGMAFFKWRILTGERTKRFYWIMMIAGYCIGTLLSYWMLRTIVHLKFDTTHLADSVPINFYQERRLFQAMGHMSLIILLYKYGIFTTLLRWLARVGQMAFSNYLIQSIIGAVVFYGFGFGLFGKMQRYEYYFVVLAIWIGQIIFSNVWLKYYRFGPFEWLWRSLTYWKKQPMRRGQPLSAESQATTD